MLTYIPSPTVGALHLGPLAIRCYALCILAGIVVAVWVTGRRLEHRGIPSTAALDVATWAVPFGIVGARIYHVITSPQAYFGANGGTSVGTTEKTPPPRTERGRFPSTPYGRVERTVSRHS